MSHNTNQDPNGLKDDALAASSTPESIADGVDEEVVEPNRRLFVGWQFLLFAALAIAYSGFHLFSLNVYPMETWSFRIVHIAGALILGYGLFAGARFAEDDQQASPAWLVGHARTPLDSSTPPASCCQQRRCPRARGGHVSAERA